MADNFRWKYGDTQPVTSKPIATATVIEIGDMVFQESDGAVKPASDFPWDGTLAETQDAFADAFLGIAQQRSAEGDTDGIRVSTAGVFELTCASATFELGDAVGPAKASGNALEDQKVAAVTEVERSVGRVARRVGSAATVVWCEIVSGIMRGGPQKAAEGSSGA